MSAYAGPQGVDFAPNQGAMESFLRFWFAACTHGFIEICWGDPQDDGKPKNATHFRLGDEAQAAKLAADLNAIPGCNVYVGTSTVSNDQDRRSTDQHFVQAPGIWGDADRAEDIEAASKVEPMLRPSAVVVTGRQPHLRRQTYHRLSTPLRDAAEVRSLNRRLHALYGGDGSVVNPVRVMRLPGSIAWPYKAGRVPELTEWSPAPDSAHLSYALDRLSAVLPPEPTVAPGASEIGAGDDRKLADLVANIAPETWHTSVRDIVASLVTRGMPDEVIHLIDTRVTLPGWDETDTFAQVQKLIDTARARFNVPTPRDALALLRRMEAMDAFAAVGVDGGEDGPSAAWMAQQGAGAGVDGVVGPGASPVAYAQGQGLVPFQPALKFKDARKRFGRPPVFLVNGFLQVNATALVTGLPGVGKSPFVQYLAACLAVAAEWCGHNCTEAATYYWGAESVNQTVGNIFRFAKALLAAQGEAMTDDEVDDLLHERVSVQGQSGLMIDERAAEIGADLDRMHAETGLMVMLVIDTLRSVAKGGVTSDEDMSAVQRALLTIREGRDWLLVVVLHHSPKSDPEGTSGSNRLDGMAEVIVSVVPATRKKPAGSSDDEDDDGSGFRVAKRLRFSDPDSEGFTHAWMRVITRRNKDWQPPKPVTALLSVHENEARLTWGKDAEGVAAIGAVPLPAEALDGLNEGEGFALPGQSEQQRQDDLDDAVCGVLTIEPAGLSSGDIQAMLRNSPVLSGAGEVRHRVLRSLHRLAAKGVVRCEGKTRTAKWALV